MKFVTDSEVLLGAEVLSLSKDRICSDRTLVQ